MAGNVESSASGIDVFWSKYPPPTNNMATVGLPGMYAHTRVIVDVVSLVVPCSRAKRAMGYVGGPKIIVVHLMNNATVGCDGVTKSIQSVYVDTR
jgi:hypothetical protein